MGGLCSKTSGSSKRSSGAHNTKHGSGRSIDHPPKLIESMKNQTNLLPSEVLEITDAKLQEPKKIKSSTVKDESSLTKIGSDSDEIYDGIPRYPRAHSQKSRSTRTKEVCVTLTDPLTYYFSCVIVCCAFLSLHSTHELILSYLLWTSVKVLSLLLYTDTELLANSVKMGSTRFIITPRNTNIQILLSFHLHVVCALSNNIWKRHMLLSPY